MFRKAALPCPGVRESWTWKDMYGKLKMTKVSFPLSIGILTIKISAFFTSLNISKYTVRIHIESQSKFLDLWFFTIVNIFSEVVNLSVSIILVPSIFVDFCNSLLQELLCGWVMCSTWGSDTLWSTDSDALTQVYPGEAKNDHNFFCTYCNIVGYCWGWIQLHPGKNMTFKGTLIIIKVQF